MLEETSIRWKEKFKRYKNTNIDREDLNTLNHEMDHFNTWLTFFNFVKKLEVYDNQYFPDCIKKADEIQKKYYQYRKITSLHSKKFDGDDRNQGGQYINYPLDVSTFSWE